MRAGIVVGALSLAAGCFWAVPGQGPNRQAHNEFETDIGTDTVTGLSLAWESTVDDGSVGDPVTSSRGVHVNDARSVYAFDRVSGARMWEYEVPAASDNVSQPFVNGGRVHVNMVTGTAADANGWTVELDPGTGTVLSGPTDERVIAFRDSLALSFSEGLYALRGIYLYWLTVVDTTTGTARCCMGLYGSGSLLPTPPPFTLTSSAVLHSGEGLLGDLAPWDPGAIGNGIRAFILDEDYICSFGTYFCPNWATPTDGTTATPPVLSSDEATAYVGTDAGTVYAVDAQTGAVRWTAPVGSAVTDAPALAHGVLYLPTAGGDVVALAADGCGAPTCAPLWSASTGSSITQQPAVAGGVVFTGSADGSVNAFDATGCGGPHCNALWSASTGSEITGAPAVSAGGLFVGTADGRLVAYALPPAQPAP